MPGVTIAARPGIEIDAMISALASRARPFDVVEPLFSLPGRLAICWSAPEGYPRTVLHSETGFALLEGTVNGRTSEELASTLTEFLEEVDASGRNASGRIADWANRTPGDFVIVLASVRRQTLLVVMDALGRLPLYVAAHPNGMTLAREIKSIVRLDGPGDLDRTTLAQMLVFGFPLRPRTLNAGVRTCAPATSIAIDLDDFASHCLVYRTWDFEAMISPQPSTPRLADQLAQAFCASCKAQTQDGRFNRIALSLSGGLDSRAVAAAFARVGVPFSAITFTMPDGSADRDVIVAERVARTLNVPWQLRRLDAPQWQTIVDTALLRDGLNFVAVAPLMQYLEALRCDYGAHGVVFSGDGGDKVLPDLRAPWWVQTQEDQLQYRLDQSIWPIATVCSMLGIRETTLRDEILEHFATYPERTMRFRDLHFIVVERGWGWLLEGEERNRSFLWHETPFYSLDVFERMMTVHPKRKSAYALYAAFFKALDPRLAAIENQKWNAALGSAAARSKHFRDTFRAQVPPKVRALLRRFRTPGDAPGASPQYVEHETELASMLHDDCVRDTFGATDLKRLIGASTGARAALLTTAVIYLCHTWGRLGPLDARG